MDGRDVELEVAGEGFDQDVRGSVGGRGGSDGKRGKAGDEAYLDLVFRMVSAKCEAPPSGRSAERRRKGELSSAFEVRWSSARR